MAVRQRNLARHAIEGQRLEFTFDKLVSMSMRTCVECGRIYEPSSGHLRCPACRSRDLCSCGSPKQGKSATCGACRDVAAALNGHWKGGQTRHKAGYILIRAPGHPRAAGTTEALKHTLTTGGNPCRS